MKFIFQNTSNRDIPTPVEKVVTGRHVCWGADNHYTKFLYGLYNDSAILGSIVNSMVDYIVGDGVEVPNHKYLNEEQDTIEDIIRRCATDYIIFGAYAIQVLRNGLGDISEIYWIDMRKVRLTEDKQYVLYSDWDKTRYRNSKVIRYERFNPNIKQANSIFYVTNKTDRDIYPTPIYSGAINAIVTSIEIGKFHLHSIFNNFAPSAIVSFNNGIPSDEEQKEIEQALNNKFSGSDNASKMLLVWNESKENAVTIERLSEDGFDQKYQALESSTFKTIFTAFRMHPALAGFLVENTGFSTQEFAEQFAIFNKTVIQPMQQQLERSLNILFGDDNIIFHPFTVASINKDSEENNDKNTTIE